MTDPLDLRDEAREILARREFDEQGQSFLDRGLGWLGDRFAWIFDRLFGGLFGGSMSGVASVVSIVVAAVLLYVLVRVVSKRTPGRPKPASGPIARVSTRRDSAAWLRVAREAEQRGDFAEAVRAHYRVGTARLSEAGRLRDDPGSTVRQLEESAAPDDVAEVDALADATTVFERVWYGGAVADAGLSSQVAEDVDRVTLR